VNIYFPILDTVNQVCSSGFGKDINILHWATWFAVGHDHIMIGEECQENLQMF